MAKATIDVNVITISEERLREIIRQEVAKVIEPGAYRAPYLSPTPLPWWQNPVISSGTTSYSDKDTVAING